MSKRSLMWLCGLTFLVGGYFLWSRGYQNLLGYGMLLLCPLMHLFMHGGHQHGEDQKRVSTNPDHQTEDQPKRPSCH